MSAEIGITSLLSGPTISRVICGIIMPIKARIPQTATEIEESGIPGPILGHVGDGNFHSLLIMEKGNHDARKAALKLAENMSKRALKNGGTVTGEPELYKTIFRRFI